MAFYLTVVVHAKSAFGRRFYLFLLLWAVRVGFEPTIRFPVYKLSRLALSTTQTPHRSFPVLNGGLQIYKKILFVHAFRQNRLKEI